jgi:hypothetical protein
MTFFWKLGFWGAIFLDQKGLFTHGIPKKLENFNMQSCSQHISPHCLFSHMLCKNISQLTTAVFATFFSSSFSRFCKKFLLVYIWNNSKSNIFIPY